jgi:hypothetical protein
LNVAMRKLDYNLFHPTEDESSKMSGAKHK